MGQSMADSAGEAAEHVTQASTGPPGHVGALQLPELYAQVPAPRRDDQKRCSLLCRLSSLQDYAADCRLQIRSRQVRHGMSLIQLALAKQAHGIAAPKLVLLSTVSFAFRAQASSRGVSERCCKLAMLV